MMTTVLGAAAAYLITGAGVYMMLEKMGEKGWKGFVPFLGEYLLFKHVWNGKMFWLTLLTAVAGSGLCEVVNHAAHFNIPLALCALAISVTGTVLGIKFCHKLSKSFGHGIGSTICMLLATPLTYLYLGFGKSEYAAA